MFEAQNHTYDIAKFLNDKGVAEEFGVDFKAVLTEAWTESRTKAVWVFREWAPHIGISDIKIGLEDYFKEGENEKS